MAPNSIQDMQNLLFNSFMSGIFLGVSEQDSIEILAFFVFPTSTFSVYSHIDNTFIFVIIKERNK